MLALISILIFGAIVIALFGYVYWATRSYARSHADHAIMADLSSLQNTYARGGRQGLITTIEEWLAEERFRSIVVLLADPSFTRLAGNLTDWPQAMRSQNGWRDFKREGQPLLRAAFETLPDGSHLLIGREVEDLDKFGRQMNIALGLGILLVFVLAGVASIFVTRRTVGRIEAINATSRAIMQAGLGQRIPLRGIGDEWDELATNLNSMLDRIEALMDEVKQVTDNVAHDLRTPLARMRGRLEKAHHKLALSGEDRSLIEDTMADLDAVLRMFSSLTRISQIEAHDRADAFPTINLVEVGNEVVELFDAAAEERGCRIEIIASEPVWVRGDRDLLFDALANLVDNSIKHGREAGHVSVEIGRDCESAVLSVADDGPGIPLDQRQQVFKRFYRLDRSRRTPGNGLGLSLVAAVSRLHGASIAMVDNAPGLRIDLHFPASVTSASGQTREATPLG